MESVLAGVNERDFDALGELVHPSLEARSVSSAAEGGEIYRGIQGMRNWAAAIDSTFDHFEIELIDVREPDDGRALTALRLMGHVRASGASVEQRITLIWTWRDGRVWRLESFTEEREALEAAGLGPSESALDKRASAETWTAAFKARDFATLAGLAHADLEIRPVIAAIDSQVFHGMEGIRAYAEAMESTFDGFEIELIQFRELGEARALSVVRFEGRAKTSGVPVGMRAWVVWTWLDGKVFAIESFTEEREALDAAGLSE